MPLSSVHAFCMLPTRFSSRAARLPPNEVWNEDTGFVCAFTSSIVICGFVYSSSGSSVAFSWPALSSEAMF